MTREKTKKLKPYIVSSLSLGSREGACLVFAYSIKEAKKLGHPIINEMTREEAIRQSEIISRNEAMFNCGVLNTIGTKTSTELVKEIYDGFEKEKTCNGCINKQGTNENYSEECGVCSRFYADGFKEKNR